MVLEQRHWDRLGERGIFHSTGASPAATCAGLQQLILSVREVLDDHLKSEAARCLREGVDQRSPEELKQKANALFKSQDYSRALDTYTGQWG
jgi:hypothetical protein